MSSMTKLNYHSKLRTLFRKKLLKWYDRYGRDSLPWKVRDIYKIWISEIMLQQTQVKTVIPYYKNFITKYPNLKKLSAASLDEIMELWSGLGFYRRAENIHKSLRKIENDFDGNFPETYDDILSLPGIGRTTASAILTFSGKGHRSILDGNVKRFLSRAFKIRDNNMNALWELSEDLLPEKRADDFIQAYMDYGSLVCKKSKPLCYECPINTICMSYPYTPSNNNLVKKTRPVKKEIWALVIINRNKDIYLEKISYDNLWKGLYSSPIFHNKSDLLKWASSFKLNKSLNSVTWKFSHNLSHIKFTFNVMVCDIKYHKKISLSVDNWYNLSSIDFGIPKYQTTIFNKYKE